MVLVEGESLERAAVEAIHGGDVEALERLLRENPGLASATIGDPDDRSPGAMSRTLLHVATDWPGHYPNVGATVSALIAAGADVNGRFTGPHNETPLHWAASSDDVAALDALLDGGADIEAAGAVIAGGSALADAVGFGQWNAARRLVERGARTTLWQAAGLGLIDRMEESFSGGSPGAAGSREDVTCAFWCACHGGQRAAAEYLLGRGADLNWEGFDGLTALDAAKRSGVEGLVRWVRVQGGKSAGELK